MATINGTWGDNGRPVVSRSSPGHGTKVLRRSLALACTAGAIFCSLSTGAFAADLLFAGSYCQPRVPDDNVQYNRFGVTANGDDTANVECPFWLPFQGGLTVRGVDLTFYDRHPSQDVECTVRIIALEGSVSASRTVSSSGSSAIHQFRVANFSNSPALGTLHMTCSIPPNVGGAFSHVTTYRLRTTP